MNKPFAIIITIATIILILLIVVLGIVNRSQTDNSLPEQTVAPTDILSRSGSSGETTLTFHNPKTERILPQTTLTDDNKVKLRSIKTILPYRSDAIEIDFSALTDKIYVQKKNGEANKELTQYLKDNNLLSLYTANPEYFVVVESDLQEAILAEENEVMVDQEAIQRIEPFQLRGNDSEQLARAKKDAQTLNDIFKVFSRVPKFQTIPLVTSAPTTTGAPLVPTSTPQIQTIQVQTGSDTSNLTCAIGTDAGIGNGYSNGSLTKIRLCRVHGFVVNSQVSQQFNDLANAASTAGISFFAKGFSGGFRTLEGQIGIYQNHCKANKINGSPPPYPKPPGQTIRCPGGAAPGYSNHQMGFALDLGCDGVGIPKLYSDASKNRCFQWLLSNASKYGFYEYSKGSNRTSSGYEGWHWSVNGN